MKLEHGAGAVRLHAAMWLGTQSAGGSDTVHSKATRPQSSETEPRQRVLLVTGGYTRVAALQRASLQHGGNRQYSDN